MTQQTGGAAAGVTGGLFRRQLKQRTPPPRQASYLQPIGNSSSSSSLLSPTEGSEPPSPASPTANPLSSTMVYGSHPPKTPKTAVFVEKYGDFVPTPGTSLFGRFPRANRHERFQRGGEESPIHGDPLAGEQYGGGAEGPFHPQDELIEEEIEVEEEVEDDPPREGLARVIEILLFPLTLPQLLYSSLNSKAVANVFVILLVLSFAYLSFLISQAPPSSGLAGNQSETPISSQDPSKESQDVVSGRALRQLEQKLENKLRHQQENYLSLEQRVKGLEDQGQDYSAILSSLSSGFDDLKLQFETIRAEKSIDFEDAVKRIQGLEQEITFLKNGRGHFPWEQESDKLFENLKAIQEALSSKTNGLGSAETVKQIKAAIAELKAEKLFISDNLRDFLVDAIFQKKSLDQIRPTIQAQISMDQIQRFLDDSVKTNFENKLEAIRTELKSKLEGLSKFATKQEVEKLIAEHQEKHSALLKEFDEAVQKKFNSLGGSSGLATFDERVIAAQIDDKLRIFYADHTGKQDYALHSGGGRIVPELTSSTYHHPTTLVGLMLNYGIPSEPPVTAIQSSTERGKCWPMKGAQGTLGIKLSEAIAPTEFSLEHIPKQIATWIESAPREVRVWGWNLEDGAKVPLASYTYDLEGPPIQTFPSSNTSVRVHVVQLEVLSNYGKEDYTCLYRFRVHGFHARDQRGPGIHEAVDSS